MLSKKQNWPHYSAEVTSDDSVRTSQKKIVPVPSLIPVSPSVQQHIKFSRVMGHSGGPFCFSRELHYIKTWHWDRLGIAGEPLCSSRLFNIHQVRRLTSQHFPKSGQDADRVWYHLEFSGRVLSPSIPVIKNLVVWLFFFGNPRKWDRSKKENYTELDSSTLWDNLHLTCHE